MKLEHLLRKIAFVIFLHHKKIVIVFSILIIASFYTIFHMKIESDVLDVLPSGNKTVTQYKDFIEKYGTMDNIIFIVESEDNRISENIDLIENIAKNLSESPLIEYVDYSPLKYKNEVFIRYLPLFLDETGIKFLKKRLTPLGIKQQVKINHDKLVSPLSSSFDYEMIARDPLNLHTILRASLLKQYQTSKLDLSMGYYFTKDHSAALLLAKPTGEGRDMAFVKKLKKELDIIIFSALQECGNPPGVKIGITGGHAIAEDIRQIIKHDVTVSSALSIIVIGLLIMLAYRVRIKILSIIGLTMLASLAVTLAFAYLLFEGEKGMREAYEDTLDSKEIILAYANVETMHKGLPNFFPEYYARRAKNKVFIRAILPQNTLSIERSKYNQEEMRRTKFLPSQDMTFSPEVNIYDNKMLIASWEEKMAVIIESKELADLQKIIFNLLWDSLPNNK